MIEGPDFSEAGTVATREMWYYANDMPAVIQRTKDGNTVTTVFDYDGLGRRIRKSVLGGGDTYYLGDYYEIENGTPVMYIYAGGLRVAKVADATKYYYHKDHLGSSSVMTNASGVTVETTQYMPFGHTRMSSGPSISNYKFTDQERDPETGLYNYDARHYDPVIGRFISADSLVQDYYDPQTLNRYAYARNNPLKYVDPDGHFVWIPVVIGAAVGIGIDWFRSPDVANTPSEGERLVDSPSTLEHVSNYATGAALGTAAVGGTGALLREAGKEALSEATGGLSNIKDVRKLWGNAKTLQDHFARHGADLGAKTADEYIEQASRFLQRSQLEKLPTKIDSKGVIRVYDPNSNTLGSFNPSGTIKTFYKPDPAVHKYPTNLDYWKAQKGLEPWTP